jgi:hypothetical protein
MSASSEPDKFREFLDAFEEVFERDWAYTKEMLGIRSKTEEQKRTRGELGSEIIPIIADDGTFIHPNVEDEVENWGNQARLLAAYRTLRQR